MRRESVTVILLLASIGILSGMTILSRSKTNNKGEIMLVESKNSSPIPLGILQITVTYDNNPYLAGLETAWGFSCLIKGAEKTILFDTGGDGSILLANMKKLGLDPVEIDIVALSHYHGDHIGGLYHFLEKNSGFTLYALKSFPGGFKKDIERYGVKVIEVRKPMKICENVYSTGELGTWIKEQSLIIQTDEGLIVITGCAHPGIVEIVSKAKDLIKDDVLLAMGGFHLGGESDARINKIISDLKELEVRYIGPCHCSGNNARRLFKNEYGDNYINIGVGKEIRYKR